MDDIVRVRCTGCGVLLEVKNLQLAGGSKVITCPKCGRSLQVRLKDSPDAPVMEQEAKTCLTHDSAKTQLAPAPTGPVPAQACRLVCGGREYELPPGSHVVGRKSATSRATVPLEVADGFMSRQHAVIRVTTLPDGRCQATIANYKNTNDTVVDGHLLADCDEVVLRNGAVIRMGETRVIFQLS